MKIKGTCHEEIEKEHEYVGSCTWNTYPKT